MMFTFNTSSFLHKEPCCYQHDSPASLIRFNSGLVSDCDLLSALAPASGKNLSAALGAHSGPEAVNLRALSLFGLICHLCHCISPPS